MPHVHSRISCIIFIIFILIFVSCSTPSSGNGTLTKIEGHVKDYSNNMALSNATILLFRGSNLEAQINTDNDGYFTHQLEKSFQYDLYVF